MAVHTIRLRAPWKLEQEGDRHVWRRVFGCPTNLSEQETVHLVIRSKSAIAVAILNGKVLGGAPAVYEVTDALEVRNKISLSVEGTSEIHGEGREPPFEVSLEIASN